MTSEHFNTILNDGLTSLQNNSDSDSNQATFPVDKTQVKKTRGANKKYYHVETYDTKEAAINSIKDCHLDYVYSKTKKTILGQKVYYRCKHSPTRGTQCSTGIFIFMPSDSLSYEIHKTNCKYFRIFL